MPYRLISIALFSFTGFWCAPASAHLFPIGDDAVFNPWNVDIVAFVLLFSLGYVYLLGRRRLKQRTVSAHIPQNKRNKQFWLGWGVLLIALVSPLDAFAEVLFSVHMIQHELIMLVAGPLLVVSRPGSALTLGASRIAIPLIRSTTGSSSWLGRVWRKMLEPVPAWILHFVGLWIWHLPVLFSTSLGNEWVHSLQHISFVIISLVFWYSILRTRLESYSTSVISLFLTAIHASLLGALLTFSPVVWYRPYLETTPEWGISALDDQQLGGLIMWMPSGIVFIVIALVLMARILRNENSE